ncbi:hypothetical protein [Falsiroseomonas sp.]|uniref:hypothetical protein n=1 Tax=Falsiroseomonas sp. TaxID=2870721 RepID=UPI00356A7D2E
MPKPSERVVTLARCCGCRPAHEQHGTGFQVRSPAALALDAGAQADAVRQASVAGRLILHGQAERLGDANHQAAAVHADAAEPGLLPQWRAEPAPRLSDNVVPRHLPHPLLFADSMIMALVIGDG